MVAPFSQIIFAIVLFWRIRGYIQHQQTKSIVFDSVVANGNPRSVKVVKICKGWTTLHAIFDPCSYFASAFSFPKLL